MARTQSSEAKHKYRGYHLATFAIDEVHFHVRRKAEEEYMHENGVYVEFMKVRDVNVGYEWGREGCPLIHV